MKTTAQIIEYLEMELRIIALEDLNITEKDAPHEVKYKNTQLGKHVAYEKTLAFIHNTHNTSHPPRKKKKNADEKNGSGRPIIVCG